MLREDHGLKSSYVHVFRLSTVKYKLYMDTFLTDCDTCSFTDVIFPFLRLIVVFCKWSLVSIFASIFVDLPASSTLLIYGRRGLITSINAAAFVLCQAFAHHLLAVSCPRLYHVTTTFSHAFADSQRVMEEYDYI